VSSDIRHNGQALPPDSAWSHAGIGYIGEGGIIVLAARRHAGEQPVGEIDRAPAADAVILVFRDVGYSEGAERRARAKPPPSSRRLSWPSRAWHDAQSPAAKISFPLSASPKSRKRSSPGAKAGRGAVITHRVRAPITPTQAAARSATVTIPARLFMRPHDLRRNFVLRSLDRSRARSTSSASWSSTFATSFSAPDGPLTVRPIWRGWPGYRDAPHVE
jgi:hypothetical protein